MNIEPYLIASSLSMVIAQRLVRILCPECKTEYYPTNMECEKFNLDSSKLIFAPSGCENCLGTGYVGRIGVFEILDINENVTSLILQNAALPNYRSLIDRDNFGLLKQNALKLLVSGSISMADYSSL